MRKLFPAALFLAVSAALVRAGEVEPAPEPVRLEPVRPKIAVRPSAGSKAAAKDAVQLKREIDRWVRVKYIEALRAARAGKWKLCEAMCADILQIQPEDLRAQRLKTTAEKRQLEHRRKMLAQEASLRDDQILDLLDEASTFPDDRSPKPRPKLPLREDRKKSPAMLKMDETLNQRISLNLIDVDLEYVLHLLFNISGVNIIADQDVLQDKRLTLQVNDMPLRELLKFIAKSHDDLDYTIGETAVWITSADAPMLEARSYPLTRGLVSKLKFGAGRRRTSSGGGASSRSGIQGLVRQATQGQQGQQGQQQGANESYLEDAIIWMEGWTDDWPAGSQWMLDRKTLTLFVLTSPDMHEKIEKMLDVMDVPPIQVLIKARFIEVVVDDEHAFGVDFPELETKHGDVAVDGGSGTNLGVAAGQGGNLIFTGRHTDPRFQMVMRMFEKNERSKLLSAPQILALNNQVATIDVSTNFQYVSQYRAVQDVTTGTSTSSTSTTAFIPDQWQTENVGFLLEVMPSVGRDMKTIILDLHPVVDEVKGGADQFQNTEIITEAGASTGTQSVPRPVIDSRELKTKLVINDGDYVIIGGLMRNTTTKTVRRVPFFGYIPLIGLLFRSTTDTVVKSNLIIVVQAKIVTPEGRNYTDSVADRLREASGMGRPGADEVVPLEIGEIPRISTPRQVRRWHTEYTDEVADLYETKRKKEGR